MATGNDKAEVGRQNGQQVDDAEKASGVTSRALDAEQPEQVFEGEKDGKEPLDMVQQVAVGLVNTGNAVDNYGADADCNTPDEDDVKGFAAGVSASKMISCRRAFRECFAVDA